MAMAWISAEHLSGDLGLDQVPATWREHWPADASVLAGGWPEPGSIAAAGARLDLPPDLRAALERAAAICAGEPALAALLAIGRHLLWGQAALVTALGPSLPERWGEAGRLAYALILLGGLDETERIFAQQGVEPAVVTDTLGDYLLWMEAYRERHGCWGLAEMGWLSRHAQGAILRLGRLQFEPAMFLRPFECFRHADGRSVLLAADGVELGEDGLFADAERSGQSPESWTASLSHSAAGVTGHQVGADGLVQREAVTLDPEWQSVLRAGGSALAVHIPAGGPLDPAACRASFAAAARRFGADAICCCDSWLLDPQLRTLMPDSNLARFLDWWQLHPIPGANSAQMVERVFGPDHDLADPSALPQRSSLQRRIVAHLAAGGRLRNGGGIAPLSAFQHED